VTYPLIISFSFCFREEFIRSSRKHKFFTIYAQGLSLHLANYCQGRDKIDQFKSINPHCHVCKEQLKVGVRIVMDRTLKVVIHATCNNLPQMEIEDQGGFIEVVLRNQSWLNQSYGIN
jgi:hypothetical protein